VSAHNEVERFQHHPFAAGLESEIKGCDIRPNLIVDLIVMLAGCRVDPAARHNEVRIGIYASVVRTGMVRVGDTITVV
jgi:hypothetical protein